MITFMINSIHTISIIINNNDNDNRHDQNTPMTSRKLVEAGKNERLAEYCWKPHRDSLAPKQLAPASFYWYTREQQRGVVSSIFEPSNSAISTVFRQPLEEARSDRLQKHGQSSTLQSGRTSQNLEPFWVEPSRESRISDSLGECNNPQYFASSLVFHRLFYFNVEIRIRNILQASVLGRELFKM